MTVRPELVRRVLARATGPRFLLGIAGSPGSGKTTLARELVGALCDARPSPTPFAVHVPMDGFHLADVELDRLGLQSVKGAEATFDVWGYLILLTRLASQAQHEIVYAPAFERDLEQPIAGAIPVLPDTRVVVTEGNYLLSDTRPWPMAHGLLDDVWFCAVDPDIRVARLIARHRQFGKDAAAAAAWVARVDEPNARLVEATARRADLILE